MPLNRGCFTYGTYSPRLCTTRAYGADSGEREALSAGNPFTGVFRLDPGRSGPIYRVALAYLPFLPRPTDENRRNDQDTPPMILRYSSSA